MSNQLISELRDAFESGITNVDDVYKLVNIMINDDKYGDQVFVLKQIERYYHEADVYWPTGFTLITSALVNSSNVNGKILGRKLLNELYDQCQDSHEALEALFFELPLDKKMSNNVDMQSFLRKVLYSVDLNEEEIPSYEEMLSGMFW